MVNALASRVRASTLFRAGAVCLLLTVLLFVAAFLGGNSWGSETALVVFVVCLMLSVVTATLTVLIALAGLVSFPTHKLANALLLVLGVVTNPMIWLMVVGSVM